MCPPAVHSGHFLLENPAQRAQLLLLLPLDFFSPPWLERLLLAPPLEALPLPLLPEPEEAEELPERLLPLPEEDEDFDLLAAMVMLLCVLTADAPCNPPLMNLGLVPRLCVGRRVCRL